MPSSVRLGLAVLFATAACSHEANDASVIDSPSTSRDSAPPAYTYSLDTLWRVTSADSGAPLSEPTFVAAGLGGVWVSDGLNGLVALDPEGRPRQSNPGTQRAGPHGSDIAALSLGGDSTIVVASRSGGRLTVVRLNGSRIRDILLDRQWTPNAFCLPSAATVLVSGGDAPLGLLVRATNRVDPVEYPWPALRDSSRLLQQVVMASAPDGDGCVIAAAFGGGFATTVDGKSFRTHPTRETVALPRVQETVDSTTASVTRSARLLDHTPAATHVAVSDTLIAIAFGGSTPLRLGLLDLYHRRTGAYLGSARVGAPVRGLALTGDTLFVLHTLEERIALSALRLMPVAQRAP